MTMVNPMLKNRITEVFWLSRTQKDFAAPTTYLAAITKAEITIVITRIHEVTLMLVNNTARDIFCSASKSGAFLLYGLMSPSNSPGTSTPPRITNIKTANPNMAPSE